jgi:amino acid transporter
LIHNLTGLLTYLIVPISLIILGIAARKWEKGRNVSFAGIICGLISILFVGILSADLQSEFAGLYQRIIEGAVLIWIIKCSFYLRHLKKE